MYYRPLFIQPKPPRQKWWKTILTGARAVTARLFMVLGFFMFLSMASAVFSYAVLGGNAKTVPSLPDKFVLSLSLADGFVEHPNMESPYVALTEAPLLTMRRTVDTIDAAAHDARVKGIVVTVDGAEPGLAHLEELRAALLRFKAAGKFAYIYSASYGQPGRGLGMYYLASVFDQIWMQPVGMVSIAGISAEMPYGRGVLDKLGVEPQFFARKEYKSVFENFMNRKMSAASREEMTALVNDIAGRMITGIASARGWKEADVRRIVDQGLYTDSEAMKAGLVTALGDYEDLDKKVVETLTGDPQAEAQDNMYVGLAGYAMSGRAAQNGNFLKKIERKESRVAIVYITGAIASADETAHAGLPGEEAMIAEDTAADILDAADDPQTKAIVLRINSPGGSPLGAEAMRRAVLQAKAKGKTVIVSMGDAAASGGYWVAAPADRIFALPQTLTGSIGVAGGKFVMAGLWNKIGLNWEDVSVGANAGMWSFNKPFSEAGVARMNAMMDDVYAKFTALVAEGRHMTAAQAEAVARGRVWTGAQAQENGLVDELGGLDAALDYAAVQVGGKDRRDVSVYILPRVETPLERLVGLLQKQAALGTKIDALARPYETMMNMGRFMAYEPLTVR